MTSVMMTLSEVAEQKKDDPSNGVHRKLKEAREDLAKIQTALAQLDENPS
jgi:phage shock protein A